MTSMISEHEKPVIFMMVLLGAVGLAMLGERLVFLSRSEPAQAHVLNLSTSSVRVLGTTRDPRSYDVDSTTVMIGFDDAGGRYHVARELTYFLTPSEEDVAVRYRRDDPEGDVRRAGIDLFLVPFGLLGLLGPFELLRRFTRTRRPPG